MKRHRTLPITIRSLTLAAAALTLPAAAFAQAHPAATHPAAVLVELFTSEGCSDCPPADELLRQVGGSKTPAGQLIVGISEHVSYWNGLGWRDPFSSDLYTARQNEYGTRFGLSSVYTPQMVVNGREQFVGSSRRALEAALARESERSEQIDLHITAAEIKDRSLTFNYSAAGLPANSRLQLMAVLVDDVDRSHVLRGENSGRELVHASVARALAPLGALQPTDQKTVSLPLPASFAGNTGHHLVLFAQQDGAGPVLGIDTRPI